MARATMWRYKPMVIGVTGSVGKTSTRLAIYAVLKGKFSVRTAEKNYNNEIGLALTILGMPHCGRNIFRWIWHIKRACLRMIFCSRHYPKILVLEYGIDRPGDMDYLLKLARPHIAVVTAIGKVPAHVEFFASPEELRQEKSKLAAALPQDGYLVLNRDDDGVYGMKDKTRARAITYGQEERADVRISNYEVRLVRDLRGGDEAMPVGISYKLQYKGSVVPVRLSNALGMPYAYAASAAAGVGIALNMNLVDIADALGGYVPPPGRMRLIHGIKHSLILDDTYNASPEAMRSAMTTLHDLPAGRRIAVLGDMLEIGVYTEETHRSIGALAHTCVDVLMCVGARAKFIADEAIKQGFDRAQVFTFDDAFSLGRALDPMVRAGDLILVKGSQSMRMERVVEEIMADPKQAENILVRQDRDWKNI